MHGTQECNTIHSSHDFVLGVQLMHSLEVDIMKVMTSGQYIVGVFIDMSLLLGPVHQQQFSGVTVQ